MVNAHNQRAVTEFDLRLIRVFLTVVECGGLSAAQSELGVGTSAISRNISDLEIRLGFKLCQRGRGGFRLTRLGQEALAHMQQLLAATNDFSMSISGLQQSYLGTLEIGMVDSSFRDPQNPLMKAMAQFSNIAPDVTINLKVGSPTEIEEQILDGRLHLGILPSFQTFPDLDYFLLYEEQIGLFAAGKHSLAQALESDLNLSVEEVTQHKLIYRNYRESAKFRHLKSRFPKGPSVLETEAVIALVESGAYIGFLPRFTTMSASNPILEVLPEEFSYSLPMSVASRSGKDAPPVLKKFITVLKHSKI